MARLFWSVNVVLAVLLFVETSSASRVRKEANETKETLCAKYNRRCLRDIPLIKDIIHYINNEATGLKVEKSSLEIDIKMLKREAKILRHRIEFPSQPDIEPEAVSGGVSGTGVVAFRDVDVDTGNNSCIVMKQNLGLIGALKGRIDGLELMKNGFRSEIVVLTEEHENMKKVVKDLKQQLNIN